MAGPLAKAVRDKFPGQYDDMSDEDLEKSVLAKYPEYGDLAKVPEGPTVQRVLSEGKDPNAGGTWTKTGLVTQYHPNKPVDLERRPDNRTFELDEYPEAIRKNLTDNPIANRFPMLGRIAAEAVGGTNQFILDNLAAPESLAGGLAGLLEPKHSPELKIPRANITLPKNEPAIIPFKGVELKPQSYINANEITTGTGSRITNKSIEGTVSAADANFGMTRNPASTISVVETFNPSKPTQVLKSEPYREGMELWKNQRIIRPYPYNVVPSQFEPTPKSFFDYTVPSHIADAPVNTSLPRVVEAARPEFRVQPDGTFHDIANDVVVDTNKGTVTPKAKNRTSIPNEIYELARGTSPAWDISAPFRQGRALIGTKEWFKAWGPMFRAYKQEGFDAVQARIAELPHIKSGLAEDSGLRLTDLSKKLARREEQLQSNYAEKVPGIRHSNQMFTAFTNSLRAGTFNQWADDAIALGYSPTDTYYFRLLADATNDLTARSPLKLRIGGTIYGHGYAREINMERFAPVLNKIYFAPRLQASTIRMLNPSTYINLPPQIRNQYLGGLMRIGGFWLAATQLARLSPNVEVSSDPNSADFGKIKIGDTRWDTPGGFQQYLVLASRLRSGKYTHSSVNGSEPWTENMGEKYGSPTRGSTLEQFNAQKLHPSARFAYDLAMASKNRPVYLFDHIMQTYMPMVVGDLVQVAKSDPSLLPYATLGSVGFGVNTYEKGQKESVYIPHDWDYKFEGGPFGGNAP